jgi:hypothetical protein
VRPLVEGRPTPEQLAVGVQRIREWRAAVIVPKDVMAGWHNLHSNLRAVFLSGRHPGFRHVVEPGRADWHLDMGRHLPVGRALE